MSSVVICVTVDWEGTNILSENLKSMTDFRTMLPEIPLTHFICPAYFTRNGDNANMSAKILTQILDRDEVGLHVHCWNSLIKASNVALLTDPPTYYLKDFNDGRGPEIPYATSQGLAVDWGHGIPLGAFTATDIESIISAASNLLVSNNITRRAPTSFRCGGWLSCDAVQSALQSTTNSINTDSSGTDAIHFADIQQIIRDNFSCDIGSWIPLLWGATSTSTPSYLANSQTLVANPYGISFDTQPYNIGSTNPIVQVPNNGALMDYTSADKVYGELVAMLQHVSEKGGDMLSVVGFHQESASFENIFNSTQMSNAASLAQALENFYIKSFDFPEVNVFFDTVENLFDRFDSHYETAAAKLIDKHLSVRRPPLSAGKKLAKYQSRMGSVG